MQQPLSPNANLQPTDLTSETTTRIKPSPKAFNIQYLLFPLHFFYYFHHCVATARSFLRTGPDTPRQIRLANGTAETCLADHSTTARQQMTKQLRHQFNAGFSYSLAHTFSSRVRSAEKPLRWIRYARGRFHKLHDSPPAAATRPPARLTS